MGVLAPEYHCTIARMRYSWDTGTSRVKNIEGVI